MIDRLSSRVSPWIVLFLSAVLVVKLLTGCTPQAPVTLTIAMSGVEAVRWAPLISRFEAQHPKIRIKVVEGATDTDQLEALYSQAFERNSKVYDLVYADTIWVPQFAAAGWLADLSDRLSADDLADFLPGDLAGGRYQDKLYRIPLRSDIGVLHFRKDLLDAQGYAPPQTFDELLQTARSLQQQGAAKWGYVWQGREYEGLSAMFVEVLAGYGGFWLKTDTGEIGLERPEAMQAINFLRGTIQQGISPAQVTAYTEEEAYRLFQQGESVFLRNWTETWATINSTDSAVSGQVGIQPMIHAPGQPSQGCQGGWGLAIAQSTPHSEEAWQAIQFFTNAEAQRQFVLEVGYLPSRRSLYTDLQVVRQYGYYPKLLDSIQNSVLRPPTPYYQEASAILQRYLHAALTDRLTPEQAMKTAAAETQKLMNQS